MSKLNFIQEELIKIGLKAGRTSRQVAAHYGLTKEYVDEFVRKLNETTTHENPGGQTPQG